MTLEKFKSYDYVLRLFEEGYNVVDETVFYFQSDPKETEHYIGYIPQQELPYWAGLCDIDGGQSFSTAKELFEAKIYDGESIAERWNEFTLISMGGININEIDESWFTHSEGG